MSGDYSAVQNGANGSRSKSSGAHESIRTEKVPFDVIEIPSKNNCCCCYLKKRAKVLLIVALTLIFLLAIVAAGIFIFLFAFGRRDGQLLLTRSRNFTQFPANNNNSSAGNLTDASMETSRSSLVPVGEGRPYWSVCPAVNNAAEVLAVYTKDCLLTVDNRCRISIGSKGVLEIIFIPSRNFTALRLDCCGTMVVSGFESFCVPEEAKHAQACVDSNLDCPLVAGQTYLYRAYETANVNFPFTSGAELAINSYLTMTDTITNQVVFCVMLPLQLYKI